MAASMPSGSAIGRAFAAVLLVCVPSISAFVSPLSSLRSLHHQAQIFGRGSRSLPCATEASMSASGLSSRRDAVRTVSFAALGIVSGSPQQTMAEDAAPVLPQISLSKFYEALYAQEVESVEFDGPKFEKAYVFIKGKQFVIGEGYQQESSVSSAGPQQVLAKIKNEIKAGNPVKWKWRLASNFKKAKPVTPDQAAGADSGKQEGKQSEAPSFFGIPIPKQLGS